MTDMNKQEHTKGTTKYINT